MADVKIWHNPRCSKSRLGVAWLEEKGSDVEVFEYLKDGFQASVLASLIENSEQPLSAFIRKNEREYKELQLSEKNLTPKSFAEIAVKHPNLLERPIVEKMGKAVVARPTEKIDDLF